jgi:two-component system, cell cycle response regulator
LNKVVLSGLTLYALLAGLGLFLGAGLSSHFLVPWIWGAGYCFLVFTVSYRALFSKEYSSGFDFTILGIIGLNVIIQITGGAVSPFHAAYFLFCAAAIFLPGIRAYVIPALILLIDAGNLFVSGHSTIDVWKTYAGFGISLVGIVAIITPTMSRIRSHARTVRERHLQLLSSANALDPLSLDMKPDALSEQNRQTMNISIAVEREGAFKGLIDMIYEMIPAHTYALFLTEREEGIFTLRAIRSQSRSVAPTGSVHITQGNGLIGIGLSKKLPQYIPDMAIPSRNLGYYTYEIPIKSLLAIPIVQKDRIAGVLVVDSLERGAFSPDNQDLLTRFAPFFSQIIEKIRISQELDLRAKNFSSLHDMSSTLNSSLDINEVLDRLSNQIKLVVPYDFCVFLHVDETTREAVITAVKGYDARLLGRSFPLDQDQSAILHHMLKQWQERRSATIHYDPDLGDRGRDISLFPLKDMQKPIKSLFGKPLVVGEKFIGAAFLGSVRAHTFTEYHRNFMDTLLNQVAMVVNNSMLHRRIQDMARTDGLTGLFNHRTFMEKLSEECKRLDRDPRPFSILLVDIDFFKKVNDTYGHPVGDIALARVAGVLKEVVRGSDFVARYGGEEFAVGMVETDSRGAQQMAERVRTIMEKTTIAARGAITFKITLSIGVASFPSDSKDLGKIVNMADEALYHAKRSGRNKVSLYKEYKDVATEDTAKSKPAHGLSMEKNQ